MNGGVIGEHPRKIISENTFYCITALGGFPSPALRIPPCNNAENRYSITVAKPGTDQKRDRFCSCYYYKVIFFITSKKEFIRATILSCFMKFTVGGRSWADRQYREYPCLNASLRCLKI